MKSRWHTLASSYSSDQELIDGLWQEIEEQYSGRKRHYHNLNHLGYMIDKALEHQAYLGDLNTVLFSIFYHDIVYNVKRQDNEQKSEDLAKERLVKLELQDDQIARCQMQIIATKEHHSQEDSDTNYLVDIDLAILGEDAETYESYTQMIRKEYAIFPMFLYKAGRKKILRHFLEMDHIFKTDWFHENYEPQARENLKAELAVL